MYALHLVITFLFSLSLLPSVSAGNLFGGCFSILPSATTQVANASTASACDALCPNNKHSFFQASTTECYCTDKFPSEPNMETGTADACSSSAYYDARIVTTSFLWDTNCYSTAPSGVTFNSLTGPDTCLKNCASYLYATFYASTAGTYYCGCSNSVSFGSTMTCGPGAYFSYYHTASQASQGLSRKRRLESELARRAVKTPCPAGQEACLIGDSSQAYECIDTSSELEACGGCTHGVLNYANSTIGQDCSVGAKLGAATCRNGQCVAFACKTGFELVDRRCVPLASADSASGSEAGTTEKRNREEREKKRKERRKRDQAAAQAQARRPRVVAQNA